MNKPKEMFFCSNGNAIAFDEFGRQLPTYNGNWFKLFMEHLKKLGVNTNKIKFTLPDNSKVKYFKEDNTYKIL